MATENTSKESGAFATRPMMAGKLIVIIGLAAIAVASFLVPDADARQATRIGGAALIFVGVLAYGFGRLVLKANRSPRSDVS